MVEGGNINGNLQFDINIGSFQTIDLRAKALRPYNSRRDRIDNFYLLPITSPTPHTLHPTP